MRKENQTVARAAKLDLHAVGWQIKVALLGFKMDGVCADEKFTRSATVRKIGMKRATRDSSVVLRQRFGIRHAAKLTTPNPCGEKEMGGVQLIQISERRLQAAATRQNMLLPRNRGVPILLQRSARHQISYTVQ